MADPTTYTVDDLCDLPAKGSGWRDPGYFHSVLIPNSPELTVKFGSDEFMSEEFKPSTALPPGDPTPHSVGLFGDLGFTGVTTVGGAEGFGKIFYGDFQSPAQTAITANKNIRLNVLIGDLAYANGFLTLWDQYGAEIEDTFGMRSPLMVSVGNHEWGSTNNSQTWRPNFTNNYMLNDAGGECGVPFKHRNPRFNDSGYAWPWWSEVVFDTVLGYTEMKVHNASMLECIFWGHPPNASGQSVKVMDSYVLQK
ncbi:hypothetical protein FOZ63_007216 [Perkinsus olseni]|uniref:Purple acid phosphatase n=1 Tax=Perkinsus olseni TaxID=32597 RepID=A0A7J6S5P2_PEROL|nr:hypothetical protein FOZ63_007216 [Perkinsus olseni]